MTDTFALAGGAPPAKRRGRPPGAKNRRPGDLAGFLDVTCGGSNALLIARRCMVTVAEVRKAGGDVEAARLAKAAARVAAFDREAERAEAGMRSLVTAVLAELLETVERSQKADAVPYLVDAALDRLSVPGGRLTLRAALEAMDAEQLALLPYTDQRQAQKVELKSEGFVPVMILDTGGSRSSQIAEQYQGALIDVTPQVSRPKSHDDEEGEADQ